MMPPVDSGGGIYEARYRPTRRTARLALGCGLFLAVALLPLPLPIVVLDVAFFGPCGLLLLATPLSRRLAFRIDTSGVTLGGGFPRMRASTAFIPWHDVVAIELFELPLGRPPTPYVHVVRRRGAPPLPSGMGYGRLNQRLMGAEFAACRPVIAWTLDVATAREVLANVAPHVPLAGSLPTQTQALSLRPRMPRNSKIRFLWHYVAPLALGCLIYLSVLHVGPAWAAHAGHGRVGTWTAAQTACTGEKDCTPLGDFVASDGTDLRVNVRMADGGPPIPAVGGSLQAIDTGDPDRVFPLGGGNAWWIYTLIALATGAISLLWVWTSPTPAIRRHLRRRRARSSLTTI
jgi:hypothetical protein